MSDVLRKNCLNSDLVVYKLVSNQELNKSLKPALYLEQKVIEGGWFKWFPSLS